MGSWLVNVLYINIYIYIYINICVIIPQTKCLFIGFHTCPGPGSTPIGLELKIHGTLGHLGVRSSDVVWTPESFRGEHISKNTFLWMVFSCFNKQRWYIHSNMRSIDFGIYIAVLYIIRCRSLACNLMWFDMSSSGVLWYATWCDFICQVWEFLGTQLDVISYISFGSSLVCNVMLFRI